MYWLDDTSPEDKQERGFKMYNLKQQKCSDTGKADPTSEVVTSKVDGSFKFVSGLEGSTRYRFAIAHADAEGREVSKYSPWSYAFKTKEDREPVSAACRRKMWALFYVDPADSSHESGLLLPQRCLGCKAQGRRTEDRAELSPLLTNVHAAHVISFAKGGPEGTDVAHAWNFVPLCKDCNLDMKTEHLIDWFYKKCSRSGLANDVKFDALFEVLYRLQRGCKSLVGGSWIELSNIVEFAKEVFKKGCNLLDGLPEMPSSTGRTKTLTFQQIKAAYTTSDAKLYKAKADTGAAGEIMSKRIDRMDKGASFFLKLGSEYSKRVAETSHNIEALVKVAEAVPQVVSIATLSIQNAGAIIAD